jgi:hypothetical protein
MRIIYVIIKVLTLPGAMLHAFFEHMCCRSAKIMIEDERTVRFDEMMSHIEHDLVKRKAASFDICFIPFFLNLAIGNLILMYGSVSILYFGRFADIFGWICLYLGIALLTNLFPQIEDVMMMNENFYVNNKKKFSKIIVAPFYGIFWLFSRLEKFGLTLITSVAYAVALPYILGLFVPTIYNWLK